MDKEMIRRWIVDNLVLPDEARKITEQSIHGFNQSVRTGKIVPFVEFTSGKKKFNLYLRKDLEVYKKTKRKL